MRIRFLSLSLARSRGSPGAGKFSERISRFNARKLASARDRIVKAELAGFGDSNFGKPANCEA